MTFQYNFTCTYENYENYAIGEWTYTTYNYLTPIPDGMTAKECLEYLEEKYGKAPKGICICVARNGGYELKSERFNEEHFEWREKISEFRASDKTNCSGDYVKK
jgi:hypothetical protein